jgi:CheY-like chemotaxis protein
LELAYIVNSSVPHALVGDVTRLRQILVNLLSNAVKFTSNGEVVVSVNSRQMENNQHQVHFAVRDTGIGIPPQHMSALFQPFKQVDSSTTRKYGGTGLGLAISHRLSQLMGGRMWAESQEGAYTIFHFTIVAESVPTPRQTHLEKQRALAGKRVLIVGNNETICRLLRRQTQNWDMLPQVAASGEEALQKLEGSQSFEVAILDTDIPAMNGLRLATEIRQRCPNLPLVIMDSVNGRPNALNKALFAARLVKPIKESALSALLFDILGSQTTTSNALPKPQASQERSLGESHPLQILIAEDNLVNQKVTRLLLQRLGYQADTAVNGLEALKALKRKHYDIILMDVQMPEMDGLEATCSIRQQWPQERQPHIVALTANAFVEDRELCLEAGMDDYISKPIKLEQLASLLRARYDEKTRRQATGLLHGSN